MKCLCQIDEIHATAPIGFRGQFICKTHLRMILPISDNKPVTCCGLCDGEVQLSIKGKIARLLSKIWLTAVAQGDNQFVISADLYKEISDLLTDMRTDKKEV